MSLPGSRVFCIGGVDNSFGYPINTHKKAQAFKLGL
jgi:hypothetical protein